MIRIRTVLAAGTSPARWKASGLRHHTFTTALSPVLVSGALESVKYLKQAGHLREKHQERAATMKRILTEAELPVMPSVSHIVPVFVGDPVSCKKVSDVLLEEYNIYVQPINYPTVPKGTERLRFTPTPLHTDEHLQHVMKALDEVWRRFNLKRVAA